MNDEEILRKVFPSINPANIPYITKDLMRIARKEAKKEFMEELRKVLNDLYDATKEEDSVFCASACSRIIEEIGD